MGHFAGGGQMECTMCAAGMYADQDRQNVCKVCPTAKAGAAGAISCGVACTGSQVTCPDGACANTKKECACPSTTPAKCADGSCVVAPGDCPEASSGGNSGGTAACTGSQVKCPDGACANTKKECACPSATPAKCADGSCAIAAYECPSAGSNGGGKCAKGMAGTPPSCEPCSPGTFSWKEGAMECTPCAANTFSDAASATRCVKCAPGTTSLAGSFECEASGGGNGGGTACPKATPYACSDSSCVVAPGDCGNIAPTDGTAAPPPPAGDNSKCPKATPFKCANGSCMMTRQECG
jgi:hypothetical protein